MGAAKGIKGLGRAATRPIGALGGGLLGGVRKKPGKGILGQVIFLVNHLTPSIPYHHYPIQYYFH